MMTDELKSVEYDQVFSMYRENINKLLKTISFLTGAQIATIGYAVTKSDDKTFQLLFLIGGLTILIILLANYRAVILTLPIVERGLEIETDQGEKGLMHAICTNMGKWYRPGGRGFNPFIHHVPFGLSPYATWIITIVMFGELMISFLKPSLF